MMPLGRNSKIEISYPSFLNMSSDPKDTVGISPEPVLSKHQSATHQKPQTLENDHPETEQEEVVEQKFEFQIKFNPCGDDLNVSAYSNKSSSRETSIVRTTRHEEDKIEESMEITIDSIQIKTKHTTTPKRLLNGYSQNKRTSVMNKSQISCSQNQYQQQSDMKSQ